MKIVSLEPFLTETICYFGFEDKIAGISHACDYPESIKTLPRVTMARELGKGKNANSICNHALMLDVLRNLNADVVVTKLPDSEDVQLALTQARAELNNLFGPDVKLFGYSPKTLEQVFDCFEDLGRNLGDPLKGKKLAQRIKAQVMDWCDNFYDRMKNKRVSFLVGVEPLLLGGLWIPDLIKLCSGISQEAFAAKPPRRIEWKELVDFKPDVIIIAPQDLNLGETLKTFKHFEKLPDWDKIPAVKRGEVIFTDGMHHFNRAGPRILDSMAVLVSAIAGFESGYITPRDCFYRLRWLELQRHKF